MMTAPQKMRGCDGGLEWVGCQSREKRKECTFVHEQGEWDPATDDVSLLAFTWCVALKDISVCFL